MALDIPIDPPVVNFQAILAEQGVPFQAGVPPPPSNLADSPMQAWTDSITSPETDEDMVVNQVFI